MTTHELTAEARALVADHLKSDLAEMLVTARDDLARVRKDYGALRDSSRESADRNNRLKSALANADQANVTWRARVSRAEYDRDQLIPRVAELERLLDRTERDLVIFQEG